MSIIFVVWCMMLNVNSKAGMWFVILASWDKLPHYMQTPEVKKYYEILQKRKATLIFKRIFDFFGAFVLSIFLLPFLLVACVVIIMDSPGGAFFLQERVTALGKKFYVYKLRTMVENADSLGAKVTTGADPRITKCGAFLRKFRIDELPQIFNILKGELSFVGVRPEVPEYVQKYSPEMMATLLLPAGVTSNTSILYKDEAKLLNGVENPADIYLSEILPQKMKYNLEYVKNFGFWYDMKIMVKTVFAVIKN